MATRARGRPLRAPAPDEPDAAADKNKDGKAKKARSKAAAPGTKVKAPAKPRVRKVAPKEPERRVARWAVCDNSAKRVGVFEYRDHASAVSERDRLLGGKPGGYYLALVKDPYELPRVNADGPAAALVTKKK